MKNFERTGGQTAYSSSFILKSKVVQTLWMYTTGQCLLRTRQLILVISPAWTRGLAFESCWLTYHCVGITSPFLYSWYLQDLPCHHQMMKLIHTVWTGCLVTRTCSQWTYNTENSDLMVRTLFGNTSSKHLADHRTQSLKYRWPISATVTYT